jgi:hypothetical protein
MRFSVEYNPPISKHAERLIQLAVPPSMTSEDGDSCQYDIDFCITILEEDNQDEVFNKDIEHLKFLLGESVAYIEF